MRRLAQSRTFVAALLVVLQVSLLARLGPCQVAAFVGSACCCAAPTDVTNDAEVSGHCESDEASEAKHCCCGPVEETPPPASSGEVEDEFVGPDRSDEGLTRTGGRHNACHCAPFEVAFLSLDHRVERNDGPDAHGPELVLRAGTDGPMVDPARTDALQVFREPGPPTRTGPPLRILHQVFLI